MYWDITSLYPSEYIDLLASFHWQLLYIRLETTTAKVAYSIATTIPRVSGKRGLADSAGNTEFQILRLNCSTYGMFIAPRDVSDKTYGGEGSHGTSDRFFLQITTYINHGTSDTVQKDPPS